RYQGVALACAQLILHIVQPEAYGRMLLVRATKCIRYYWYAGGQEKGAVLRDHKAGERAGSPLSEHARKNRAMWEASSDSYEHQHATALSGEKAMAWGMWRIPEEELHILGDVAGKDMLELGCGAARWSIALARQAARPVGLDFSSRQLQHARRLMKEAGVDFPLVEASAEDVPLPDTSFDIVFCDWGAMPFCDPERTVPEAAR